MVELARGRGGQLPQEPQTAGGLDAEPPLGGHRRHLVPLDVDGAEMIGARFEAAAIEQLDLAGERVAVHQLHDVGLLGQGGHGGENTRRPAAKRTARVTALILRRHAMRRIR